MEELAHSKRECHFQATWSISSLKNSESASDSLEAFGEILRKGNGGISRVDLLFSKYSVVLCRSNAEQQGFGKGAA